jgi:hypothetical protein
VAEQPHAIAKEHRYDKDNDLIQGTNLDALPGHIGAEDVDVLVAGGRLGLGDGGLEVTDERHAGDCRIGRAVGEHELLPLPSATERLPLVFLAAVRVVAAKGPVADQHRTDAGDEFVHDRVRPVVLAQPGHVTAGPGDEAVQGHRRRVQQFGHDLPPAMV